jgi:hypothetical protein
MSGQNFGASLAFSSRVPEVRGHWASEAILLLIRLEIRKHMSSL